MSVIKLTDGSAETVFDRWDLLDAVKKHMGYEAMRMLEDYFDRYEEEIAELQKELEELKNKDVQESR